MCPLTVDKDSQVCNFETPLPAEVSAASILLETRDELTGRHGRTGRLPSTGPAPRPQQLMTIKSMGGRNSPRATPP